MPDARWIELQQAAGAVLAEETAWSPQALHFGDARAEYQAAKDQCAVFELSGRVQIELTGEDRATFLHNFFTNDIKRLAPGKGCEAFVVDVKAHVLAHVFVFAGETSIWIDTVPGAEEALLAHLDKYLITEDVELHGRSAEFAGLFVTGPTAAEKLTSLGLLSTELSPLGHCTASDTTSLRRVDWFGSPGYLISTPRTVAADCWQRLVDGDIRPAGDKAFQSLRLETAFPLYGIDISNENLAQEVDRTAEGISYTKGCYLGQEPIARIDALGHVNKELRGLHVDSPTPPAAGAKILADDDLDIGRVTSAAFSFADDHAIALGYLKRSHLAAETNVRIETPNGPVAARVFRRADGDSHE